MYCFSVSKAKVQDLYRLENMRRFALAIALQVRRREPVLQMGRWFMTFELKELEQIAFRLTPLKRSVKNRASDKQRVQTSTPVECQLSYGINWSRRTLGVQNPCRHASLDNSRHLFFVTFCSASKSSFPILTGSDFFHIRYFILWWL